MKGGGTCVTQVTVGVRTDIEKLLSKFVERGNARNTVRYSLFMECFNEMKFSLIFAGRTTENELREFEEKVLSIVLSYCFPSYAFQVQIGGLYLLYALYYLQPNKYRMKIRAIPAMLKRLNELLDTLISQAHFDACYVLSKLFRDDAFLICAHLDEHNPLTYRRFDSQTDDMERVTQTVRSGKSMLSELLEDTLLAQLETLHQQYVSMKDSCFEWDGGLPQSMSLITSNITDYVKGAITDCENRLDRRFGRGKRRHESTGDIEPPPKKRDITEARKEIRQRAYATVSEGGRFTKKKNRNKK